MFLFPGWLLPEGDFCIMFCSTNDSLLQPEFLQPHSSCFWLQDLFTKELLISSSLSYAELLEASEHVGFNRKETSCHEIGALD